MAERRGDNRQHFLLLAVLSAHALVFAGSLLQIAIDWSAWNLGVMTTGRPSRAFALGLLFVIPLVYKQARAMSGRNALIASVAEVALGSLVVLLASRLTDRIEMTHDFDPWSFPWIRAYAVFGLVAFGLSFASYRVPAALWKRTVSGGRRRVTAARGLLMLLLSLSIAMLAAEGFFHMVTAYYPSSKEPSMLESVQAACLVFAGYVLLVLVAGLTAVLIERPTAPDGADGADEGNDGYGV